MFEGLYNKFGGYLKCNNCGKIRPLSQETFVNYMVNGWPKCCGYTMTWKTEKILNDRRLR